MRGEWIEILKTIRALGNPWSLPMRGEWIEMGTSGQLLITVERSLPMRGEWIEIAPRRP